MKKSFLVVAVILGFGLAACAAFRRPISGRTIETRTITPADDAKIRSAAADAQAAAEEQQARLAGRKPTP